MKKKAIKGPRWLKVHRGLYLDTHLFDIYLGILSFTLLNNQNSKESKAGLLFVVLTVWRGPKG